MNFKALSFFVVIAFSLVACGESTASSVPGVSLPAKVEVIPDN